MPASHRDAIVRWVCAARLHVHKVCALFLCQERMPSAKSWSRIKFLLAGNASRSETLRCWEIVDLHCSLHWATLCLRARRTRTNTEETKRPRRQRIKPSNFAFVEIGIWSRKRRWSVRWRGRSWRGRLRGGAKIPFFGLLPESSRGAAVALTGPGPPKMPRRASLGSRGSSGGPESHQGLTM